MLIFLFSPKTMVGRIRCTDDSGMQCNGSVELEVVNRARCLHFQASLVQRSQCPCFRLDDSPIMQRVSRRQATVRFQIPKGPCRIDSRVIQTHREARRWGNDSHWSCSSWKREQVCIEVFRYLAADGIVVFVLVHDALQHGQSYSSNYTGTCTYNT